jgi:hypothetical protein
MAQITWQQIVRAEPRLIVLLQEAKSVDDTDPHFCANEVWYAQGGLRDRLTELVGWGAQNPVLRTSEAYDVAYNKVYGALPDCKDCHCL